MIGVAGVIKQRLDGQPGPLRRTLLHGLTGTVLDIAAHDQLPMMTQL